MTQCTLLTQKCPSPLICLSSKLIIGLCLLMNYFTSVDRIHSNGIDPKRGLTMVFLFCFVLFCFCCLFCFVLFCFCCLFCFVLFFRKTKQNKDKNKNKKKSKNKIKQKPKKRNKNEQTKIWYIWFISALARSAFQFPQLLIYTIIHGSAIFNKWIVTKSNKCYETRNRIWVSTLPQWSGKWFYCKVCEFVATILSKIVVSWI